MNAKGCQAGLTYSGGLVGGKCALDRMAVQRPQYTAGDDIHCRAAGRGRVYRHGSRGHAYAEAHAIARAALAMLKTTLTEHTTGDRLYSRYPGLGRRSGMHFLGGAQVGDVFVEGFDGYFLHSDRARLSGGSNAAIGSRN